MLRTAVAALHFSMRTQTVHNLALRQNSCMMTESIPQAWQSLVFEQRRPPLLVDSLLQPLGCLDPADFMNCKTEHWLLQTKKLPICVRLFAFAVTKIHIWTGTLGQHYTR